MLLALLLLQRTDQEMCAVDLYGVAIERARRGPAEHLPVHGEGRRVARALEVLRGLIPVVSAAQMRTLRSKSDHLIVGLLDHPGRRFLATDLPAVHFIHPILNLLCRIHG